jgi:hypothetical protein
LTITNLAGGPDDLTITVEPSSAGPAPVLSENQLNLSAGESKRITVNWTASGASAGEYQGILRIRGTRSGVESRVPYWLGVPSNQPKYIHVVTGSQSGQSLFIRAVDQAGIVIGDVQPTITVVSGPGRVNGTPQSWDDLYPGYWRVSVRLSVQAPTVFRIEFGSLSQEITVDLGG